MPQKYGYNDKPVVQISKPEIKKAMKKKKAGKKRGR
jgi:hypothetical protein